jgi:hypothetical protein
LFFTLSLLSKKKCAVLHGSSSALECTILLRQALPKAADGILPLLGKAFEDALSVTSSQPAAQQATVGKLLSVFNIGQTEKRAAGILVLRLKSTNEAYCD